MVVAVVAVVSMVTALGFDDHNVWLGNSHTLWALGRWHARRVHSRLHHRLHAWLHHWLHARLHPGLHHRLHARLHLGITGLARRHHARLHTRLHAGLHHWLHTRLHSRLHGRISRLSRGHHARLHTRLHHGLHARLHAWLHHRLHTRLHHTRLHHARLHHTRLHHAGLHHTWLHHTWLHHLLLSSAGALGATSSSLPDGLEVNLACLFTFVGNLEPLIDAVADAEGRKLEASLANNIITANILVKDLQGNIVADILHIDVECFVPDGSLAGTLLCLRFKVLLARSNLDVGVHLAEGLRVTCQPRLNHGQGETS